jgi:hypothetical protein
MSDMSLRGTGSNPGDDTLHQGGKSCRKHTCKHNAAGSVLIYGMGPLATIDDSHAPLVAQNLHAPSSTDTMLTNTVVHLLLGTSQLPRNQFNS